MNSRRSRLTSEFIDMCEYEKPRLQELVRVAIRSGVAVSSSFAAGSRVVRVIPCGTVVEATARRWDEESEVYRLRLHDGWIFHIFLVIASVF